MNSKKNIYKLGRKKPHREAMKKNLLTSLVLYEHVQTTKAKAKSILPLFDKLIKTANKTEALATRGLRQMLFDENAIKKVNEVYKERFKGQSSGLVKYFRLPRRKGDNAELFQLFVKGYAYKDIGKLTKKAKTSNEEAKQVKTDAKVEFNKNVAPQGSQVKGAGMQGKAKSRSGI
jgi:large subunit ribosomal protein L17